MALSNEKLVAAYSQMKLIRAFEEGLHEEAEANNVFGFAHLYAGAEACAVGVCHHLETTPQDTITSTHRAHGHFIAKGGDVNKVALEIFGRRDGSGGGKGGTMHVADWSVGMHGGNGIIGASAPHALGAAFTAKYKRTGGVAVAFGGDGASNQGAVFESMNFAKAYELPVVFVLEDNGYAESTHKSYTTAGDPVSRASGFGIPSTAVDGADFFAVADAAGAAIERARSGGGPSFIHCDVPLFYGHFEGEAETYRADDEVAKLRADRDCLKKFRKRAIDENLIAAEELNRVDESATRQAAAAIATAKSAPQPLPEALHTDVYATY
jgi:acetoin:2,6-dichlorophenolindophenol oxidoreductase subunit alpha